MARPSATGASKLSGLVGLSDGQRGDGEGRGGGVNLVGADLVGRVGLGATG